MKIIETAEGIALKVSDLELLNIYGALLFNLAKHNKQQMPITTEMAKTISKYLDKPF